ncbi:MAG: hypothetical protein B6D41_11245 [Chloroflexi bacterium UTCFX4]|jgi:hypothetical protein|nr:MAG: hypothetical protein B6D41_11245 [Chloroflexi bacterium UTCFX4]
MTTLISLVGDQPAPNVIPVRHFAPKQVALIHTKLTQRRAEYIADVLGKSVVHPFCQTEAYRVDSIKASLSEYIERHGWNSDALIFNLTGGTKTMAIAALELAQQMGAAAFYYQTEENQSLLHVYHFDGAQLICQEPIPIRATLTIDEFLRLYIGRYEKGEFKNDFERNVAAALEQLGADYESCPNLRLTGVGPNVEIDGVVRFHNTIGVIEVCVHATKKDGIDQLAGVTDQKTLGTYTKKFLVSVDELHANDQALATAYRIIPIVLPSGRGQTLAQADKQKLIETLRAEMEPRKE